MRGHMYSDIKSVLEDNYELIWKEFLELQIKRSCEAVKLFGNANSYLVLQVIAWHNFLIITDRIEKKDRTNILENWLNNKSSLSIKKKYILTYTLISELTGLHLETVRRHVKRLQKLKWVHYSKDNGVEFKANKENNRKLAHEFNANETNLVLSFLKKVNNIYKKNEEGY